MKGKEFCKKLLILTVVFCLGFGSVPAKAAALPYDVQTTAQKAAVKGVWKKEKVGYCYYENGKKVTKAWRTIGGKKYYFGNNGARKTGWYSIGKTSYYFDSKGVYKKKKAMDATLLKQMDAILKVQKITENTADKTALTKLANYAQKIYKYKRVMGFHPSNAKKGWEMKFAKEMITTKKGSCYHDAAAFAFLAKRATGLPVRICLGTSNAFNAKRWQEHGWVEIKMGNTWYTYDTNAARNSSLRKGKWYCQKRTVMEGKIYKTQKTFYVEL